MSKTTKPKPLLEAPRVRCCDCKHGQQDTEGISRSIATGEYFMCHCAKDHDITRWGQKAKLFWKEERTCPDFRKRT